MEEPPVNPLPQPNAPASSPASTTQPADSSYPPPKIYHVPGGKPPKKSQEQEGVLPDAIKITHTDTYHKDDPPLIDLKITNPVTYLKNWWKRVLGNEGILISFRIRPLTAILMSVAIAALVTGTGFTIVKYKFLPIVVPSSFFTKTSYLGTVQKSASQFFLVTPSSQVFTLKETANLKLDSLINHRIVASGKLDNRTNIIEVSEITPAD